MTNIIGKVQSLGFDRSVAEKMNQFILNLDGLGVQGVDKLIKKLKKAPDIATFQDYWLEGTYACKFAENNLSVTMEPCGSKGPDIHTNIDKHDIYVEVKHLRLVNDQSKSQKRAVAGTIRDKLRQTLDNEINMVILQSDRFEISKSTFYNGLYLCKKLCQGSRQAGTKFLNLNCVVISLPYFGSASNPFHWRFLTSSKKQVPREVKGKLRQILATLNESAHQRILNLILQNSS